MSASDLLIVAWLLSFQWIEFKKSRLCFWNHATKKDHRFSKILNTPHIWLLCKRSRRTEFYTIESFIIFYVIFSSSWESRLMLANVFIEALQSLLFQFYSIHYAHYFTFDRSLNLKCTTRSSCNDYNIHTHSHNQQIVFVYVWDKYNELSKIRHHLHSRGTVKFSAAGNYHYFRPQ